MPSLEPVADVYVLHLGDDENRFDGDWLKTVFDLVAEVANAPAPRALVTTRPASSGRWAWTSPGWLPTRRRSRIMSPACTS